MQDDARRRGTDPCTDSLRVEWISLQEVAARRTASLANHPVVAWPAETCGSGGHGTSNIRQDSWPQRPGGNHA